MPSKLLKSNYGVSHQTESFFTGTYLEFEESGEHFFCSYGSSINKVSTSDGQVKANIKAKDEEDVVVQFALSPDGQLIVIAYASGLVAKFNLVDSVIEREFKSIHNAPISKMKINPSGTSLATGSSDGTIKLWNLKNHYCSHNLKGVNGVVSCIEFLEVDDRNYLFCSGGDDLIHVFDLDQNKRITRLKAHCSTITDMKISSDLTKLISVGRDKLAAVWDISKKEEQLLGQRIRTIPLYETVESVVILDSDSAEKLLLRPVDQDSLIFTTIGEEGLIKFWDAKTGAKIFEQNVSPLSSDRSPNRPCFQLCSRPKHNQLCAISLERDIFVYDLPHLSLSQQLQGHIDEILSACWFASDKFIALACNSVDLKVIDISNSKCQHLKGHKDIVLCVKPVPKDPFCLISSSKDCTILVWKFNPDDMSARIQYSATGHTNAVHSLGVLYGESTFLSAGEDTTLKRWSFSANSEDSPKPLIASQTIKAHDDRVDDIDISPNDQLVATGSRDKTAKIFSVANLQVLGTLKGHRRGVNAVRFSPIDQVIVTAADLCLRLWNLNDFSCLKTFQGHDCAVLNVSFLSSGLQLLSVGSDGNMKLWDVKANECTKTIDAHSGLTWALSITSDDDLVVTGGQDEKLVIWKDVTKEEQEERLANMQFQVLHEQDFQNHITKKKWRKALLVALSLGNQAKTLCVIREILLDSEGVARLEKILKGRPLDQIDFILDCCTGWMSSARNSPVAQQVMNIVFHQLESEQLMKMPSMLSSMDQLKTLTEKSFSRYERLAQEATFVDFFLNSTRIQ